MRLPIRTLWAAAILATPALAQQGTYSSGSTGSDGALTFPANAGIIDFDPDAFNPILDPDRDYTYHFTTITIPAGTTVRLRTRVQAEGRPIVWLATGAVSIVGILDLNGDNGHDWNQPGAPAFAGAGGYNGGIGSGPGTPPTTGNGPGGGAFGDPAVGRHFGGNASHLVVAAQHGAQTSPGATYGNLYLRPLVGGSGGGGAAIANGRNGSGGGAGGGAIVIASSLSIDVAGSIRAQGGSGGARQDSAAADGGGGSGGGVRLVAPTVQGSGTINVSGGFTPALGTAASHGRVRLEAFRFPSAPSAVPTSAVARAAPSAVFLPGTAPLVKVLRVAGVTVVANPTGSFVVPDVAINAGGAVTVEIEGRNVPLGTTLNLTFQPENGSAFSVTSSPLVDAGGGASSASATVTFQAGFTRVFVRASWTP